MILRRYLLREVGLNFLGVSLLFTLMFLSSTFIRLLTETLEGDYPARILFTLFALKGVGNLVFILPLAFFIGVMLAFGRLYKDSEMVVFTACGVRPQQVLRAVAIPALAVALLVAFLALWFAPWSEEQSSRLLDQAGARTEVEGIIPGQFNQFDDNGPVIYAESAEPGSKHLNGVFVQYKEQGQGIQITAAQAYEEVSGDLRYLILLDGFRYEGEPGQAEYRIIRFKEYAILMRERVVVASARPRYAIETTQLIRSTDPANTAELQWRIAMPISVLLLGLLAVPLSKTSPRKGRFGGLFLGIMIYVVYNNLLTMARTSLSRDEIPAALGLWWVHILLLLMLLLILWRQNRLPRPRPLSGGKP